MSAPVSEAIPDAYDVAIVGAGPAGIAAACTCCEAGLRVVLVDQNFRAGGQIWRHIDAAKLPRVARVWLARLDSTEAARIFQASVIAADHDRTLTLSTPAGLKLLRARAVILATGGRELFLPFPGWTLPWVIGAGGAQALLKEGMSFRQKRVVVAGSGPLLLPVAATLARGGARVTHVLEQADARALQSFTLSLLASPEKLLQAATFAATFGAWKYSPGSWVERATGAERLESVVARVGGRRVTIPCDVLCTGYGLVPAVELARLFGCAIRDGVVEIDGALQTSEPGIYSAGETAGVAGMENAIAQGIAAACAVASRPVPPRIASELRKGREMREKLRTTFGLRGEVKALSDADTIVCRCEDVREREIDPSWTWRELKLQTRIGMGPCQGRVCGAAMRERFGMDPGDTRVPAFPVPLEVLARGEFAGGLERR